MFYHFRRLRLKGTRFRLLTTLRKAERKRVGRNAQPSAAIIDAQSVKTVEESASICGFDAHKHVKGRKRHIAEDGWDLEVVERPPGSRGFSLLPKRWAVE